MTTGAGSQGLRGIWSHAEGDGPLVAVAIHDGHDLRPEVAELMSLPEEARHREEDPFTAGWTPIAPTRLIALRSRFEVDLNRPRERAVYIRPEDAWGLRVWHTEPSDDIVHRSLKVYDDFYRQAKHMLDLRPAITASGRKYRNWYHAPRALGSGG